MSERKLRKFRVNGRVRADIEYDEIIEAKTWTTACKTGEKFLEKKLNLDPYSVLDCEHYCERLEEIE